MGRQSGPVITTRVQRVVVPILLDVDPGVGIAPFVSLPGAVFVFGAAVLPVPGPPIEDVLALPVEASVLAAPVLGMVELLPVVPDEVPVSAVVLVDGELPVLPAVSAGVGRLLHAPSASAAVTARIAAALCLLDVFIGETPWGIGLGKGN